MHPPAELNLNPDEKFLYNRLTRDPETGAPLPFLSLQFEISLMEPIEDIYGSLKNAVDAGCDDCWSDGESLYIYGQTSLTVEQIEIYEDIMEKYRPWQRSLLEKEIEVAKRNVARMEEDLERFIW